MEIESVEDIIMNPEKKDEREREKGDAGRCTKQSSKRTKDLASLLLITCECGYEKQTYSSHTVEKHNVGSTNKGMKPFDINIRAVYGMRTIGSDHTGLEKMCGILNLHISMTVKKF